MPKASQNKQFVGRDKNVRLADIKSSVDEVVNPQLTPNILQPSPTPTPSQFASPTPTKTPTKTPTQTRTQTPTRTSTPTNTKTPTNTRTQTKTPTPTKTNTPTNTTTKTPTSTPTSTTTPTNTPTSTITQTNTPTNTTTPSNTPTNTRTSTNTPTASITATNTPTNTVTATPTATSGTTLTPTPTNTRTPSITPTNTPTKTVTMTPSATTTPTVTKTATQTRTPTNTRTATITPSSSGVTSSTPTPTNTQTPTNTSTPTPSSSGVTSSTPTPTNTQTPTNTPTNTGTATPTNTQTNTPSLGSSPFNLMYTLTDPTHNLLGSITESYNNRVYTFSTGSTEVYSLPSFSSVTTLSSFISASTITESVFDSTNNKIYVGSQGDPNLNIIDVTNDTSSSINITGDTFGLALDLSNNLLALINTSNGGPIDDVVVVIDTTTDTVVRTIQNVDTFKGGIASDQNGYCYVVGNTNIMTKVDIVNGVTAQTININENGTEHKVIYNTNNNYIYTLAINNRLRVWDSADNSFVTSIDLTSYSGTSSASETNMVYDSNLDRIYIINKQTGGSIGIITVRCDANSVLGFTNNIITSTEFVHAKYDTVEYRLYLGDTGSSSISVLST